MDPDPDQEDPDPDRGDPDPNPILLLAFLSLLFKFECEVCA